MNKDHHQFAIAAVVILALTSIIAMVISILYFTALQNEKQTLLALAESQAKLFDASYDISHEHPNQITKTDEELLAYFVSIISKKKAFGETGEFVLGKLHEHAIHFLLPHRFGSGGEPPSIPVEGAWAEPMRRALNGESGAFVAPDYRGEEVIAGYALSNKFNIGIVAKRDLREFRQPYIKATLVCVLLSIAMGIIAYGFIKKINRFLKQSIKDSNEFINLTFKSITDAVITIDNKGIIQFANQPSSTLFGYSIKDMIGKNVSFLMPTPHKEHHDQYLNRYLATKKPNIIRKSVHLDAQKKDGTVFPIILTVSEYSIDGKTLFTGVIRDISVEQKIETLRKSFNEELQRSNQELANFAYVASHDLRAPLRGIKATANWIQEDLDDHPNSEVIENLTLMKSRIDRLDNILESLLEYSRVSTRKHHCENIDLNKLFSDILLILNIDEQINIIIPEQLPTIKTVRIHIQQVFQNLIDNAIKHHDKLVPIEININIKDHADYIACSVTDNGPGIEKNKHIKVFEIFQRLVRYDEIKGTGIGLALVKKLIELHGNNLQLISEPPTRGCTFTFNWKKEDSNNV